MLSPRISIPGSGVSLIAPGTEAHASKPGNSNIGHVFRAH
jgi:hypothetical protein